MFGSRKYDNIYNVKCSWNDVFYGMWIWIQKRTRVIQGWFPLLIVLIQLLNRLCMMNKIFIYWWLLIKIYSRKRRICIVLFVLIFVLITNDSGKYEEVKLGNCCKIEDFVLWYKTTLVVSILCIRFSPRIKLYYQPRNLSKITMIRISWLGSEPHFK